MEKPEIKIEISVFALFIRRNNPSLVISNEELEVYRGDFEKYLIQKNLTLMQWEAIKPRPVIEILLNYIPFHQHGFHPQFVLHFLNFIQEKIELADQEEAIK